MILLSKTYCPRAQEMLLPAALLFAEKLWAHMGPFYIETVENRPLLPDPDACPVQCLPNGIPPCGPPSEDSTGRAYFTGVRLNILHEVHFFKP
jgi:hypothetical protein